MLTFISLTDILRYHSIIPSICGIPGDLHIIGNKRRASDIEDDTSDEDEQDQARFVLYYNSDSSSVRSRPYFIDLLVIA